MSAHARMRCCGTLADVDPIIQLAVQWEARAAKAAEAFAQMQAGYQRAWDDAKSGRMDREQFAVARALYTDQAARYEAFKASYEDFYAQHPGLHEQVTAVKSQLEADRAQPFAQPQAPVQPSAAPAEDNWGQQIGWQQDSTQSQAQPSAEADALHLPEPLPGMVAFDPQMYQPPVMQAGKQKKAPRQRSQPSTGVGNPSDLMGWGRALLVTVVSGIVAGLMLAIPVAIVAIFLLGGLIAAVLSGSGLAVAMTLVLMSLVFALMTAPAYSFVLKLLIGPLSGGRWHATFKELFVPVLLAGVAIAPLQAMAASNALFVLVMFIGALGLNAFVIRSRAHAEGAQSPQPLSSMLPLLGGIFALGLVVMIARAIAMGS